MWSVLFNFFVFRKKKLFFHFFVPALVTRFFGFSSIARSHAVLSSTENEWEIELRSLPLCFVTQKSSTIASIKSKDCLLVSLECCLDKIAFSDLPFVSAFAVPAFLDPPPFLLFFVFPLVAVFPFPLVGISLLEFVSKDMKMRVLTLCE